jgi:hypothetical protein
MAGKHRKISRPAAAVAAVVAPGGIAAAALAISGFSPGAAPSTTEASAPSSVDLLALITPANSTSQFFAGTTYYGQNWTDLYGTQQTVPFLAGPSGIAQAIHDNNEGPGNTGVTASGWGAGQTGTALGQLSSTDIKSLGLVILDNNTNRAGGGFWTTYAPFAPLLGTSAEPTPSDIAGLKVLDVAYEYNINSDAPVDPLNPFALGNSLAAYAYGYGQEGTALNITQASPGDKPVLHQANGTPVTLQPGYHYIVKDGNIVNGPVDPVTHQHTGDALPAGTTTTFVTVESSELPLTRPLRLLPGGDIVADAIDPTMKQLVDAGYNDGKGVPGDPAVPADPTVTRPMQPGSSLGALGGVPGSIPVGLQDGAQTAIGDVTNPTNFITKPIDEAGNLPSLPGISSLPGLSSLNPSALTNSSVSSSTLQSSNPNKFLPGLPVTGNNSPNGSSGGANGLKSVADNINNAVKKVTGGLTGGLQKNSGSTP